MLIALGLLALSLTAAVVWIALRGDRSRSTPQPHLTLETTASVRYPRPRQPPRPAGKPPFKFVERPASIAPSKEDGNVTIWTKGLWVRTLRDRGVSFNRLREAHNVLTFTAAGVTFQQEDLQRQAFGSGREVRLQLDPTNPVDPEAVGIYSACGRYRCGYVPSDRADEVRPRLPELKAVVMLQHRLENGRGQRVGVSIMAWDPTAVEIRMLGS